MLVVLVFCSLDKCNSF